MPEDIVSYLTMTIVGYEIIPQWTEPQVGKNEISKIIIKIPRVPDLVKSGIPIASATGIIMLIIGVGAPPAILLMDMPWDLKVVFSLQFILTAILSHWALRPSVEEKSKQTEMNSLKRFLKNEGARKKA